MAAARAPHKRIQVAVAFVERGDAYLICRRARGDDFLGFWEFPGGKRHPGEAWEACLRREVREELGVELARIRPAGSLRHRYPTKTVSFRLFRCAIATGRPKPLASFELRWVDRSRLWRYRFPPANRILIQRLRDGWRRSSTVL